MRPIKTLLIAALFLIGIGGIASTGCSSGHSKNSGSWDTTRTVTTYRHQSDDGAWLYYYLLYSNGHYYNYSSPTQITNFSTTNTSSWTVTDTRPAEVANYETVSTASVGLTDLPGGEIQSEIAQSEPTTTEGVTSEAPSESNSSGSDASVGSSDNSSSGDAGSSSGDAGGGDGGGGGGE